MQIQKLEPSFHERVWGSTRLEPWFPNPNVKIGEVWFDNAPEDLPLVKFLFTTEKLSVQVHPNDEYARVHHNSPGKSEMWHVLAAEPGAQIAAGFREPVTKQHARAAALSGEIEELLQWYDARPGDTFFIPAGTIHAIGAGLTICEIQQRSNITYRLYDYGRPRELHLEHGFEVATLVPTQTRTHLPVICEHFVTSAGVSSEIRLPQLLIVTGGSGVWGETPIRQGEVFFLSANQIQDADLKGDASVLNVSRR
jgi:mannose-6-phosphate isomerase